MLVSLTNLANVIGRLGVLEGDEALVKKAKKRLWKALKLYAATMSQRTWTTCAVAMRVPTFKSRARVCSVRVVRITSAVLPRH